MTHKEAKLLVNYIRENDHEPKINQWREDLEEMQYQVWNLGDTTGDLGIQEFHRLLCEALDQLEGIIENEGL